MKWICLIFLIAAVPANAGQSNGTASKFGIGPNRYCVISATKDLIFLELRSYSGDGLLHDVVLMSRYMEPEYEIEDVALDEHEEVIVRTRGGGTDIKETHLEIFGFMLDRIVRFGDFIIDRQLIHGDCQEKRSGTVSLPEKNELVYQYTDSTSHDGKTTSEDITETFKFDSKTMSYRSTKEPEPVASADGGSTWVGTSCGPLVHRR
ncbi:MAG: hypothetical protein AB2L11_10970 [Syntrophobacteraceae bacterium]